MAGGVRAASMFERERKREEERQRARTFPDPGAKMK
jgi:hypothetical protein